jgi:hypothetical protein
VNTFSILQTLLGIINSRKNKFNPTGPLSAAASSDPSQANVAFPLNPAVDPLNAADVALTDPVPQSDMTSATAFQENASNIPLSPSPDGSKNPGLLHGGVPRPSPYPPPQGAPQTEDSLRQQLQQADLYDLSGEKAAAEALKRDDAFKQQQIDQKAEQTKEFFAQQDQKQQQTLQDVRQQAGQQLHEQQEKEFWDQKKSMEMQAGMNKELLGLHEAARQAHQEWRNDFTQGVCRDDVAALYNKDITDRVGQYKARLDDIGTNPVDKVQTIEKYKVKLTDEVAPQVEQETAEVHKEHFPEFQGGNAPGHGGPGHGGHGHPPDDDDDEPEEGEEPEEEEMKPPGENKEPFFKNIDEMRTESGQDIPEGWMKPIDPPISEQIASKVKGLGAGAVKTAGSTEGIEAGIEVANEVAGEMQGAEHGLGLPGLPSDVTRQIIEQGKIMREHGLVGVKATAQIYMDKAKRFGEDVKEFADTTVESAKELGQNLKVAASEAGEKAMYAAENAMARASGAVDAAVGRAKELTEDVQVIAEQASYKALNATQDAVDRISGTVDAAVDSTKEFGANVMQKWEDSAPARQKMANEIRETGKRLWEDESGSMDMNVATGGLASVIQKKLGQQESPDPSSAPALSGQDAKLVQMLQARAAELGASYTGPKPEEFANSIAQKNQESEVQKLTGPKETLQVTDQKGSAPDPGATQTAPPAPTVQPPKPQGPSL